MSNQSSTEGDHVTVREVAEQQLLKALTDYLTRHGSGRLTLVLSDRGDWASGMTFGREAPDSPMVSGAAYGRGATAGDALAALVSSLKLVIEP